MENSVKYVIVILVLALGFTEYNIFVNNVISHDAYMRLGQFVGMLGILYLGYISTKKPEEKKVEENKPKI
jgi:hypothetical protein